MTIQFISMFIEALTHTLSLFHTQRPTGPFMYHLGNGNNSVTAITPTITL